MLTKPCDIIKHLTMFQCKNIFYQKKIEVVREPTIVRLEVTLVPLFYSSRGKIKNSNYIGNNQN